MLSISMSKMKSWIKKHSAKQPYNPKNNLNLSRKPEVPKTYFY